MVACSTSNDNRYIRSLHIPEEVLAEEEDYSLEEYGIFNPRSVLRFGNILAFSCYTGDFNIDLLNLSNGELRHIIRRGRGPGEMVKGVSFHESEGMGVLYDYNSAICVGIDIARSFESGEAVMDTLSHFNKTALKPYYCCKAGKGFISGNLLDKSVWYSYYDCYGHITDSIEGIGFAEIKNSGQDFQKSLMLSSIYASSPDATKVCVANVASVAISFSELSDGILREYKRYEIIPPKIITRKTRSAFSPDNTDAFHGIQATEDLVYLLYSGNKIHGGQIPGNEGSYLIAYDWKGHPKKLYRLSRHISAFHITGKEMDAVSSFPEAVLFKFHLN